MRSLKFILIALMACFMMPSAAWSKDKADDAPLRNYVITGAGRSSTAGSYLVKVTVTTKDAKLPDADIARCAVHGVLFHGFSGENTHFEKPLARSAAAEAQNQEFFDNFFKTQASSYAHLLPSTRTVSKIDKKKYVITQTVEVQKDQLRKALQDAGVLKSLNSGF